MFRHMPRIVLLRVLCGTGPDPPARAIRARLSGCLAAFSLLFSARSLRCRPRARPTRDRRGPCTTATTSARATTRRSRRCCRCTKRGRRHSTAPSTGSRSCSPGACTPRPRTTPCTRWTRTTVTCCGRVMSAHRRRTSTRRAVAATSIRSGSRRRWCSTPRRSKVFAVARSRTPICTCTTKWSGSTRSPARGWRRRTPIRARPQDSLYIQQRAGLALGNGRVYIGYGGHGGDCGPYHGWMVSLTERGTGKVAFDVTPHTGLGAIWARAVRRSTASGRVFAATGNPDPVVEHRRLRRERADASTRRCTSPALPDVSPGGDNDLGSVGPILLPNNLLFQIGKQQTRSAHRHEHDARVAHHWRCVPGEAFGGMAFDGTRIFVPCADRIRDGERRRRAPLDVARLVGTVVDERQSLFRSLNNCGTDPPTLAGGLMWNIDRGAALLYGLNPGNGRGANEGAAQWATALRDAHDRARAAAARQRTRA